jgi:hypothetical protein
MDMTVRDFLQSREFHDEVIGVSFILSPSCLLKLNSCCFVRDFRLPPLCK